MGHKKDGRIGTGTVYRLLCTEEHNLLDQTIVQKKFIWYYGRKISSTGSLHICALYSMTPSLYSVHVYNVHYHLCLPSEKKPLDSMSVARLTKLTTIEPESPSLLYTDISCYVIINKHKYTGILAIM